MLKKSLAEFGRFFFDFGKFGQGNFLNEIEEKIFLNFAEFFIKKQIDKNSKSEKFSTKFFSKSNSEIVKNLKRTFLHRILNKCCQFCLFLSKKRFPQRILKKFPSNILNS